MFTLLIVQIHSVSRLIELWYN